MISVSGNCNGRPRHSLRCWCSSSSDIQPDQLQALRRAASAQRGRIREVRKAVTSRQEKTQRNPDVFWHGSHFGSHHGAHHSAHPLIWVLLLVRVHSWPCRLQFDSSQPDAGKHKKIFTDPNVNFGRWFFNTLKLSVVSACCTGTTTPAAMPSRVCARRQAPDLIGFMISRCSRDSWHRCALYLVGMGRAYRYPSRAYRPLRRGAIFSIWLLKGYFDSVPVEIEESADRRGHQVSGVHQNIAPLARPVLYVVALINFWGRLSISLPR